MVSTGAVARFQALSSSRRLALLALAPILLRLALVPLVADFEADAYSRMLWTQTLAEALRRHAPLLPAMYIPVWPPAWHFVGAVVEQPVTGELLWRPWWRCPERHRRATAATKPMAPELL
jgi:hypothetical protein